ncbi:4'-phosphopantetheinyl transferase family protein [Dinghuibacter silviterrae]|uniref:4'-phosphopantetheinyl transferase superfamily protein n=1 Tax=Dinghuibacter silviterrae TaxID=1539049 RepID=A0A4V3GLY7_9BACT|nr:4'-phosphopantetheinyl transferase superfamily protein [Dinghuibacter silviterrae]TDX01343.1 4'-phosphopantetheinyl transferase superfamily protein [Dinghuibacter silviterrae]
MRSIGYDIVDLSLTDPHRNARPRFYQQILAPAERTVPASLSFHQYLWLCWSVKEAVYKYACRWQPGMTFSPTRMVLSSLDASLHAVVRWEGRLYQTRSSVFPGYIVSVAHDGAPVRCGFAHVGPAEDPSAAVRRLLLSDLGPGWSVERRYDGCPTLVGPAAAGAGAASPAPGAPLSFSHHGAYAGYALVGS